MIATILSRTFIAPVCALGLFLGLAGSTVGQRPAAADESAAAESRLKELIQQLGAEDFATREKAQAQLAQLGLEAFDALHAAQKSNDPEIALRAKYLVRSMSVRWFQDSDSTDVVRILKGYGELADSERKNRMDRLAALENRQGVAALCRLSRFETQDPLSKYAAIKVMDQPAIADDAARGEMGKTILSIVGHSKRAAAGWLRLYVRTLDDPGSTLADWNAATAAEHSTLAKHPEATSREIVRDLYRWHVELLKRLDRPQEAVAVIRRTFSLLDGTPEEITEVVDWLIHREAWEVVQEVAQRFEATFNENPLLLYRLAEAQLKQGQGDKATATAEKALALRAENWDEHFLVAFKLQERGLHRWAEREYRAIIAGTPAGAVLDFRSRYFLSELLHDQLRDKEAGETLKVVCDLMDNDEAAKETCGRALPDNGPEGLYSRMHLFFALAHIEQKEYDAAYAQLSKGIASDPTDADALIALYRLPNQTPERIAETKRLIDEATKVFRDEVQEFRQASEQAPNEQFQAVQNQALATACNQLAWLVGNTYGNQDEALECSQKSLELRPNYPGFLDTLGRCYYAKGDLENAVKFQSQAAKLDPYSGQIRRQLEFFKKELAAKTSKSDADVDKQPPAAKKPD